MSLSRMSVRSISSVTTRKAGGTTWWMWTATACWISTLRSPPSPLVSNKRPGTAVWVETWHLAQVTGGGVLVNVLLLSSLLLPTWWTGLGIEPAILWMVAGCSTPEPPLWWTSMDVLKCFAVHPKALSVLGEFIKKSLFLLDLTGSGLSRGGLSIIWCRWLLSFLLFHETSLAWSQSVLVHVLNISKWDET